MKLSYEIINTNAQKLKINKSDVQFSMKNKRP